MGALRELLAKFDVDTGSASAKLAGVDSAITGLTGKLGGLADAFIGSAMVKGLSDFVEGQIAAAREVRLTSAKLGVGTEQLEQFQFAAGAAGVSAEGAAMGLKFLNKNLGLAIEGNDEASQTFKKLGIDVASLKDGTVNAADVLPQLADAFGKIGSQPERTAMAMKIFGRQGADMIPLLQGGSKGLEQMRERFEQLGGGMSTDFIDKAKDAGKALAGMRFAFAAWKRSIAIEIFPYVTAFGEKMQTAATWVQHLTKETNIAKDIVALLGAASLASGIKAAMGFARFMGVLKGGSLITSLGSFGLIVAAVAAAGLAFEDLWTAINGGDSVLKDFLEETMGVQGAKAYIDDMRAAWNDSKDSILELKEPLKEILVDLADLGRQAAPEILLVFEFLARAIGTAVAELTTFIALLLQLKNIADADFVKKVDHILDKNDKILFGTPNADGKSYGGLWGDTRPPNFAPGADPNAGAFVGPSYLNPASPDYQGATGAGAPATQVTQHITPTTTVIVQGSPDAKATADAVVSAQRGAFADATQDAAAALATRGTKK